MIERGAAAESMSCSADRPVSPEAELALIREALGAGSWRYDLRTGELELDAQLLALCGYPPDGQPGRNQASGYEVWRDHVHPADRHWLEARIQSALRRLEAWDLAYRIQRADGEIRHMRCLGRPEPDDAGHPREVAGVAWDITERVARERELKTAHEHLEHHERYRLAQEAARFGIWEWAGLSTQVRWHQGGIRSDWAISSMIRNMSVMSSSRCRPFHKV